MNILTTVHKNGIVNQVQIVSDDEDRQNKTLVQLIWNDEIHGTVVGLNKEPVTHSNCSNRWLIKDYRAVYINGIMIVKNGKVWPRRRWFGI